MNLGVYFKVYYFIKSYLTSGMWLNTLFRFQAPCILYLDCSSQLNVAHFCDRPPDVSSCSADLRSASLSVCGPVWSVQPALLSTSYSLCPSCFAWRWKDRKSNVQCDFRWAVCTNYHTLSPSSGLTKPTYLPLFGLSPGRRLLWSAVWSPDCFLVDT